MAIEWRDLQYGDRVQIDMREDPIARNYSFPAKVWGVICNTHTPGELVVMFQDLEDSPHLTGVTKAMGGGGFMWHLVPDSMDRVLKHERKTQSNKTI